MLYFVCCMLKCYGLYAKIHMLDWNMPNTMTIAMSFSMTTEQVGYLIIYISIILLWLSILPLQEEIAIIPPGLQFISQSLRYFSMPAYHGKSKVSVCRHMLHFVSWPAYFISWPACFITRPAYFMSQPAYLISWPAYLKVTGLRHFSLLAHQVIKWYLESQDFQYASISWQEPNFSMPAYHGKSQILVCQHIMARAKFQYASISWHRPKSSITVYFGSPAYQGIYQ
jgi:hypothetical protein